MKDDRAPVKYPAYCPSHLAIHETAWCTTQNHISLADHGSVVRGENGLTCDFQAIYAEARRRGYCFFQGDVENLRDSADDPKVGDVVGDKRCVVAGNFHLAYLREVVKVTEDKVVWKRPGKTKTFTASKKNWRAWAKGSWRCSPKDGEPTRRGWRPPS